MNYQAKEDKLIDREKANSSGVCVLGGRVLEDGGGIEQKEKERTHGHGQECGDCEWVGEGTEEKNGDGKIKKMMVKHYRYNQMADPNVRHFSILTVMHLHKDRLWCKATVFCGV